MFKLFVSFLRGANKQANNFASLTPKQGVVMKTLQRFGFGQKQLSASAPSSANRPSPSMPEKSVRGHESSASNLNLSNRPPTTPPNHAKDAINPQRNLNGTNRPSAAPSSGEERPEDSTEMTKLKSPSTHDGNQVCCEKYPHSKDVDCVDKSGRLLNERNVKPPRFNEEDPQQKKKEFENAQAKLSENSRYQPD